MTTSTTHKPLGALWPVSPLTLGGGGIAGIWGETTRQEAVQTVQTAVEEGINLIDVAPMYGRGEAESVVGEALQGRLPEGVHVTSKILLGTQSSGETLAKVRRSIGRSLDALKLDRIDLFFLHSNIIPNDYLFPGELAEDQHRWSVTEACFYEAVVPAFEAIQREGIIGAWGITGIGMPRTIMDVLKGEAKPQAVQVIANLLDSPGAIKRFPEAAQPRNIIRTATESGVGVLGIRAVQAGALTRAIDRALPEDHPEVLDYHHAAPFRALCETWNLDPADVAHQYALAIDGVDTVILGVKNREELLNTIQAAKQPLTAEQIEAIDALDLRKLAT